MCLKLKGVSEVEMTLHLVFDTRKEKLQGRERIPLIFSIVRPSFVSR